MPAARTAKHHFLFLGAPDVWGEKQAQRVTVTGLPLPGNFLGGAGPAWVTPWHLV